MKLLYLTKENIISMLQATDKDILISRYPQYSCFIEYYAKQEQLLIQKSEQYIQLVRKLYQELNYNRKFLAIELANHTYRYIGFKALNNDKTAKEILEEIKNNNILDYCNLIPNY